MNLPKSIYESPYYWMCDDNYYKDIAQDHRGDATESITQDLLAQVFGSGRVFRGVKVTKGKDDITDIDVLAVSGNKAVVAQCKSKKLTFQARAGDSGALRKDFIEAIQGAYDQAIKARRALIGEGWVLRDTNRVPIQLPNRIEEVFILCVTGDHYPAVMAQARTFFKKEGEAANPIFLSIFDLDVVAFYLNDKHEFLYYLKQRSEHTSYFVADSEMALLGFHLNRKLFPDDDNDLIWVDQSYGQLIDANFLATRGGWPETEASKRLFHTWKNGAFDDLVDDIKLAAARAPNAITAEDLLFFLYDLAGDAADQLIDLIWQRKRQTLLDGKRHDFRMPIPRHKKGVTFISFPQPTKFSDLRTYSSFLEGIAIAQKYKSEADKWMALGSIAGSPVEFDMFGYIKSPWQQDSEMDKFLETQFAPGILVDSSGRRPGRNQPYPCKSGKKFKRCHGR